MLPDGPKTPKLLRMLKLIVRPLEYLEDYSKRYGDIFKVGDGEPFLVYVSHPKAIQDIFAAGPDQFKSSGNGGRVLQLLLGEQSVVLLDGDRHQRQRKLLMPPFHGDRLRAYSRLICETTEQVTEQWQVGQPYRVRLSMQEITLHVILQAVFGLTEGVRYDRLRYLLGTLLESISSPLSAGLIFFRSLQQDWGAWSPWGKFLRQKQLVDQLIYAEIQERRATGDDSRDDILSLLLSARDEAGQPMTDRELRDELVTLLIAGHETTASALTWALYWIHAIPEVQEKVRSELASLGDRPEPGDIARLPYLTAVCQETLRIYPVTLTTGVRVLDASIDLLGYQFEAGTVFFPCTYLVHQRPDLYPEPKQFKPERFLERQFAPHEYLPFGGGHRYCIGRALAMLEMKLVLATVLSNWQLDLIDQRPVKPVRRGLTIAPPAHLQIVATARVNHSTGRETLLRQGE
ncbi:MAG: cytochrome P450 [Elainellaceae cyanobacterium]